MRRLLTVPTVLLALAAAACSGGERSADTAASRTRAPGTPAPSGSAPTVPGQPVECGRIRDALGTAHDVSLYADPGADGTVGCGEAHDVMADFFHHAPQDGGGTSGSLTVHGWLCRYEGGPTGTWVSSCRKDRLEMHTEEPDGPPSDAPGSPSDEPGSPSDSPDESQLPPLPDDSSTPVDDPSTEEL
ncbi:hypothetical protein [Streptomyces sp. NPDC014733]|uniref:hypothetical protein n=1 Tax=Streptomyces sp. NPDC014733 TaxID=3364885 RepID=UPI0036F530A0